MRKMSSSQWTSEYAIRRDLSQVQGRVPVAIEGVGAGDKPPTLSITEETEEEFFKHCSADADVGAAPDLKHIKQMLDMVRNTDCLSDEEDFSNKVIIVTKLNPSSSVFVPKTCNTSTPLQQSPNNKENTESKVKPKKRHRNVALESILKAIAEREENAAVDPAPIQNGSIPIIEIKGETGKHNGIKHPVSPVTDTDVTVKDDIKKKITGWFDTQTEGPFTKKAPKVILESTTLMFKRKNVPEKEEKARNVESNVKQCNMNDYKPSTLATEYYQKYVERNKFKESVKDDIWSRAERKMKEIEEKRKRELAEASTSSSNQDSQNEDIQSDNDDPFAAKCKLDRCSDKVSLSQHRHLLTEDCIVCKVFLKYNYIYN